MDRTVTTEEEEPKFDPDARDVFVIIPGRYYAAMFFMRLPTNPNDENLCMGGDINALIWRQDDTPEHWVIQYRFRYYKSRHAFQSGDKKVWCGGEVNGSEQVVVAGFQQVLDIMSTQTGFPVERIDIKGNNEQFFRAVKEKNPEWLHIGITDEQANKGGNAAEN